MGGGKIHRGDLVSFGAYGDFYVACVGDRKDLWVTKKPLHRTDPRAPGRYIGAYLAKRIIERYRRLRRTHGN